ncbi:MAG: 23S rRNA (uracil(1939)-C(5))-methyltransferase RlmD [Mogibacterium sp.]|nr:23S rRNA (uracil(1939)-C(5))-methyltransferase RlmD [Mogibacterium sp.]
MEKKQIIELRIEDMLEDGRAFGRSDGVAVFVSGGCEGEGVADFVNGDSEGDGREFGRSDGVAVFVSAEMERDTRKYVGAVVGDVVRAEVVKAKKSFAEARLLEVLEPSPERAEPECPYFGECGGCTLQELRYEAQLALKRAQVRAKLERLGGIAEPKVNDCVGAEALKYYRNKAVFAVGPHGEVGFLKRKSHFVMDIDDCLLQSDAAMVCADALRAFFKMPIAKGLSAIVKQMTVRTAFGTGEVMVAIESEKKEFQGLDTLVEMLDDAVYSLSLDEEGNTKGTDMPCSLESVVLIHKGKSHTVAGKPAITEIFNTADGRSIEFEISPQSFFQVNHEQMAKLYDKAAEYAALKGGETVLDLYCGAGTIGIWLLDELRARNKAAFEKTKVIGIESVKPAVLDANRNSVINGLTNTRYFCGRAEEELPGIMGLEKLYKWNEINERVEREPEIRIGSAASNAEYSDELFADRADVIILDPPRAGCDEALLAAVAAAQPDCIVYVSCDPATLARDVKYLCAHGYDFAEATPIDQFPLTSHIEVVAKTQKL